LNLGQFRFVFLLSLFCLKNRVCLPRGVQVAGAIWCTAMRIMKEVRDLVQRTEDNHTDDLVLVLNFQAMFCVRFLITASRESMSFCSSTSELA
jgi:hypothetical protein